MKYGIGGVGLAFLALAAKWANGLFGFSKESHSLSYEGLKYTLDLLKAQTEAQMQEIAQLKLDMAQKDAEIAELRLDLAQKDKEIDQLQAEVEVLKKQVNGKK